VPDGSQPAELYEPLRYMLALGGKRIRPLLALLGCELFGAKKEDALPAAAAIELFHNFTLVHDDIMDNAPLRRNRETIHRRWNGNIALLSGDAMLVMAYRSLARTRSELLPSVLDVFNETALQVCEGQQLDMNFEKKEEISIDDYLHMIMLKTAVLLAGSLKIGAIIGKAGAQDAELLYQFGCNIGVAFQLQDDILDVYGDTEKFGKQKAGDIIAGKKTFLFLKAAETAPAALKKELKRLLESPTMETSEKVQRVTGIYDELDVRTPARILMEEYYQRALSCFDRIRVDASASEKLLGLSQSLMIREI